MALPGALTMSSFGSVTVWIEKLKLGDDLAAQKIWQSYFERLIRLARQHLYGTARAAADEEDVVLSAFDSFFRSTREGRFPRLNDRDDLWQLLVLLTCRKTCDLVEYNARQKRGAATRSLDAGPAGSDWPALVSAEPTPDFAAQLAEEVQHLLGRLETDELRTIALWKLEGYSNAEIAARLQRVERTVERKLWLIKKSWETGATPA